MKNTKEFSRYLKDHDLSEFFTQKKTTEKVEKEYFDDIAERLNHIFLYHPGSHSEEWQELKTHDPYLSTVTITVDMLTSLCELRDMDGKLISINQLEEVLGDVDV